MTHKEEFDQGLLLRMILFLQKSIDYENLTEVLLQSG